MIKSIARWLAAIVATRTAGLLAVVLVPVAVMCARQEATRLSGSRGVYYRLPRWARWLETHDEHDGLLPGGLYEPAIYAAYQRHGWRWASMRWLWRNRAYRYSSRFQFRPNPETAVVHARGRLDVGANGPGFLGVRIDDAGRTAWELYFVMRLFGQRGLRVRLGYKLQPLLRAPRDLWPQLDREWDRTAWAMPVCFVSPWAKVAG